MIATIVETKDLLQTVAASLIAGVGVTASFSLLIFALTRAADMARDERPILATAAGVLGILSLAVTAATIVVGIVVMTRK
jgi:hypothetical protein